MYRSSGPAREDTAIIRRRAGFVAREPVVIERKFNNCLSNDPCAICGARTDPNGFDPFLAGTYELVCDACADIVARREQDADGPARADSGDEDDSDFELPASRWDQIVARHPRGPRAGAGGAR
jgi:hypothetical protein